LEECCRAQQEKYIATVEERGHRGRPRFGYEDGVTNIKLLGVRIWRNAAGPNKKNACYYSRRKRT